MRAAPILELPAAAASPPHCALPRLQNPLIESGNAVFAVAFWLLTAVIFMCVVICMYVGYSFKTERFALVWPVVFVRRVVSVLVSALFTSSLNIILSCFNCDFQGPVPVLVNLAETEGEYTLPCLEWPFSFSAGAGVVASRSASGASWAPICARRR